MKTLRSQHSLNKFANYSGLGLSILIHSLALLFFIHLPTQTIKPVENKPIKMSLESFDIPKATAVVSSAPEIAQTVMIPEPTPPAPPPPPPPEIKPPEPKPTPPEPKPEPKPKPKPEPKPKPKPDVKKPTPPKKVEIAQPTPPAPPPPNIVTSSASTQDSSTSTSSAATHNLPPNGAEKAAAPVSKVGELNLANAAGDPNFAKIVAAIKKHQRYPKNAAKMRHQGVVEVRFLLTQNGDVQNIKVIKSSGYSSLDDGAIDSIERASKDFPNLPSDYYISIPISFKLI